MICIVANGDLIIKLNKYFMATNFNGEVGEGGGKFQIFRDKKWIWLWGN